MALKVSGLADENAQLAEKCEQLERDLEYSLNSSAVQVDFGASMGTLQLENHELHAMMEEMVRNQMGMNKKTEDFVQAHEEKVHHYEEKLSLLRDELIQTGLKMSSLKQENKILCAAVNEASDAEEYFEKEMADLTAAKEAALVERDDAYKACDVLQKEIDMLRSQLKDKSKGLDDSLTSLCDTTSSEASSSEKSLSVTFLPVEETRVQQSPKPLAESLSSEEHHSKKDIAKVSLRKYSISNDTLLTHTLLLENRETDTDPLEGISWDQERRPWRKYDSDK
jgi:chromosome segregation ATPase